MNKQIGVLGTIAVWRSGPDSESDFFFDGGGVVWAALARFFRLFVGRYAHAHGRTHTHAHTGTGTHTGTRVHARTHRRTRSRTHTRESEP